MKTKLEAIAAYLAGRGSDDDAMIQAELEDPSSEVSRFLASTRVKSRAILDDPGDQPSPLDRPRSPWPWVASAALGLACFAGLAWLVEARFRRLEATLIRERAEARALADRLVGAVEAGNQAPAPPAVEPSLKAIEARLDRLASLLDRPGPVAEPARPDPAVAVAELRLGLEAIRREVLASERASSRQVQELRALIQELGQSIRRASAVSPAQLQAMVNNLASPMAQARLEALEQIGRLGPDARSALTTIRQMIPRETDARVRAAAEAAIERLGPD